MVRLELHVAQTWRLVLIKIVLMSFGRPAYLENDIKRNREGVRILIRVARSNFQCLVNTVKGLGIL